MKNKKTTLRQRIDALNKYAIMHAHDDMKIDRTSFDIQSMLCDSIAHYVVHCCDDRDECKRIIVQNVVANRDDNTCDNCDYIIDRIHDLTINNNNK
jgi:hypothetical protein